MNTFKIQGKTGESTLLIGERLRNLPDHVPGREGVIVTDANVQDAHGGDFPPWPVIRIGIGESIKTLETVTAIYERLLDMEADRSDFIIGIGGGVVCDVAGFAASTYMRGLRFGFVATTLLSQVDASAGGKTGVNLKGYKNIVGVFNQPQFVICDPALLKTLPQKEILSGLGEIAKHAVIGNPEMFNYLESHSEEALNLDPGVIEKLVYDSLVIKSGVVNQDEKESGIRRILNFGHTFGHAVETITGLTHGEAVSAGMMMATSLSVNRGLLARSERDRIKRLLKRLNLPIAVEVDPARLVDALRKDKKRSGENLHFVLLKAIGQPVVERLSIRELEEAAPTLAGSAETIPEI